jgi:hypothetical protein
MAAIPFRNAVVVMTGGASGLGKAICGTNQKGIESLIPFKYVDVGGRPARCCGAWRGTGR